MNHNNSNNVANNLARYKIAGNFVPAGKLTADEHQENDSIPSEAPATPTSSNPPPTGGEKKVEDVESEETALKPPWMKAKLQGVKKISNKERRRRQNENLRRLLMPKSALMVLNEIVPGEQVAQDFRVEPASTGNSQFYSTGFCADLTVQGNTYKGYGDNKLTARNAAAEQAVRDLILGRMARALQAEGADGEASEGAGSEEESLPMIQLASFAIHKLFTEWEYEGHKVPQLRSPNPSMSEGGEDTAANPRRRELPEHAAAMHPCMLLTYMRPQLEYRELAVTGDRPQNMHFTMGIEVDGTIYTGKASNKKEARKAAARAACVSLFGVQFESLH